MKNFNYYNLKERILKHNESKEKKIFKRQKHRETRKEIERREKETTEKDRQK